MPPKRSLIDTQARAESTYLTSVFSLGSGGRRSGGWGLKSSCARRRRWGRHPMHVHVDTYPIGGSHMSRNARTPAPPSRRIALSFGTAAGAAVIAARSEEHT